MAKTKTLPDKKITTPEEAFAEMQNIYPASGYDTEGAHSQADELMRRLLRELGYGEAVKVFEDSDKWYA